MKVVIIGAGISGLVAAGAFRGQDVTVIESSGSIPLFKDHHAVMRLRNDRIKEYIDCKVTPINVQKSVYHEDKLYDSATIEMNNRYSLNTRGVLGERSLGDLGKQERFTLDEIYPSGSVNFEFGRDVRVIIDGTVCCWENIIPYDICISTIPMPSLLKILKIESDQKFEANDIHVFKTTLPFDSTVHQTIYFTEADMPYRATIEGREIIIESVSEIGNFELVHSLKPFGLGEADLDPDKHRTTVQKMGKLVPIDDIARKRIMTDITSKFSIYSFGRFATWKSIRIDQTLDDIEKIKTMVKVVNREFYYDL